MNKYALKTGLKLNTPKNQLFWRSVLLTAIIITACNFTIPFFFPTVVLKHFFYFRIFSGNKPYFSFNLVNWSLLYYIRGVFVQNQYILSSFQTVLILQMPTRKHYFEVFLVLSNLLIEKRNKYLLLLKKACITVYTCITYMSGCSSEFLRSLYIKLYLAYTVV